ncbi:MAG TPA: ferredoxin-thioredoxin reductase catalytic domain-containing protein [Spirochaetia bacterium]|nr:ferredoxin-thioredoxin reductase catalytic domain-containing protein [Spirochaetia bacterium]
MSAGGDDPVITPEQVQQLFERLKSEAESSGYHLNPNVEFTKGLVEGLLVNEARYGYWACPCRLASGQKEEDLDIICPCDYRDPDLDQYDTCYCALYVSQDVVDGKKKATRIPERRPEGSSSRKADEMPDASTQSPTSVPGTSPSAPSREALGYPVWRCRVCGYLCARGQPPAVCPICKAKKERFERFL